MGLFEERRAIINSFVELTEKEISNNTFNFFYQKSLQKGKKIVTELSHTGNGYVLGQYMSEDMIKENCYKVDNQGWISIAEFSHDALKKIIYDAMESMSGRKVNFPPTPKVEVPSKSKPEMGQAIPNSSFEKLVRACLYNWLGYGNVDGSIWFIGVEEGGAEVWRNQTRTLEESLYLRSNFGLSMDFKYVWEDLYSIPLESFKGPNVWRYAAAFLLEYEGLPSSPEHINDLIFKSKHFGIKEGNHFICEMFPLPKQKKDSIVDYNSIWRTLDEYYNEVEDKRFELITNTMKDSEVELIVSYDRTLNSNILNYYSEKINVVQNWEFGQEAYSLYKLDLIPEKTVHFLSCPFFGNGRISYDGIKDAANKVKMVI
jgi:hypothetical protein